MAISRRHSLRRTSPKGQPFIGICVLCGQENLTINDMQKECPNIRSLSENDAVIEAIKDKRQ